MMPVSLTPSTAFGQNKKLKALRKEAEQYYGPNAQYLGSKKQTRRALLGPKSMFFRDPMSPFYEGVQKKFLKIVTTLAARAKLAADLQAKRDRRR